jgi:sugar phosphate isomerase/epimerase
MEMGIVSAVQPEYSLEAVLGFAAAGKFSCVEIMCWPVGKAERKHAGVTHNDVSGMTQARADDLNALDPDAAVSKAAAEHLKKVIHAAEKMGLENVNSLTGRDRAKSVDENWPHHIGALVESGYDSPVCVGVGDDTFGGTLKDRRRVTKVSGNMLRSCFA